MLWKRFLKKKKIELPYDFYFGASVYARELKARSRRDICTRMFLAASFTTVKTWKQPKCPLTGERISKMRYILAMEYCSTLKKREVLQMNFEDVVLNKISHHRRTSTA